MLKTTCVALAVTATMLTGCDDPATRPPKAYVAAGPVPPTVDAVRTLRGVLGRCEAAMDSAADPIGRLAAGARPSTQGRGAIEQARQVCGAAGAQIQTLPVWGRLKDPCARAAHAREAVADGALAILNPNGDALAVPALRDKIADQVALSRDCAGEIAMAERQAPAN